MKNFRFLSIIACACAILMLAACNSGRIADPTVLPSTPQATIASTLPTTAPTMGMGGMATPVAYNVPDDVTYIDMMIPHHKLAVEMAKIAQEKATHGELKGLANDIIRAQEDEIKRMGSWRVELTGSATPDPSKSTGMGSMAGMDVDLNNSPYAGGDDRRRTTDDGRRTTDDGR